MEVNIKFKIKNGDKIIDDDGKDDQIDDEKRPCQLQQRSSLMITMHWQSLLQRWRRLRRRRHKGYKQRLLRWHSNTNNDDEDDIDYRTVKANPTMTKLNKSSTTPRSEQKWCVCGQHDQKDESQNDYKVLTEPKTSPRAKSEVHCRVWKVICSGKVQATRQTNWLDQPGLNSSSSSWLQWPKMPCDDWRMEI